MKTKIDTNNFDYTIQETPKDIVQAFRSAMFDQREHLEKTLPYQRETLMLNYVKNGQVEELKNFMKDIAKENLFIGKLSKDPLRQAQYMLVCSVSLATRYAVEGGMPELEAYNLSDVYIQKIDHMTNPEEVMSLCFIAIVDFTKRVRQSKKKHKSYSYPINLCLEYINSHLHYKISLEELAEVCKLSPQYLSALFKKETGRTITNYILEEKLETAKQMLTFSDYTLSEIANYLAFCSHSTFTDHFRKRYDITPREYRDSSRSRQMLEEKKHESE